jgi:polysaccharide deacetylase 2 family uncharacterized protein YibQ
MPLFQRKQLFTAVFVVILCSFISAYSFADSVKQPTIAIIIDDMGNQYQNGLDLVLLPYPLTLSFLPSRPHTEQEIKSTLSQSFKAIPHMIGINNHMGSKLTAKPKIMRWVMEEVRQHHFYFVDSRTSVNSVAAQTAKEFQIPTLSRDVFLDHHQTRKFVQEQFLRLIKIAKEKGTAVAIAHPHKVTVDYLSWALPKLDEKGIRIATISALWHIRHPNKKMYHSKKISQNDGLNTSNIIAQQSTRSAKERYSQ